MLHPLKLMITQRVIKIKSHISDALLFLLHLHSVYVNSESVHRKLKSYIVLYNLIVVFYPISSILYIFLNQQEHVKYL